MQRRDFLKLCGTAGLGFAHRAAGDHLKEDLKRSFETTDQLKGAMN